MLHRLFPSAPRKERPVAKRGHAEIEMPFQPIISLAIAALSFSRGAVSKSREKLAPPGSAKARSHARSARRRH